MGAIVLLFMIVKEKKEKLLLIRILGGGPQDLKNCNARKRMREHTINFAAIFNKLQACATSSTEHFIGPSKKKFSSFFFIFL